MHNNAQQNVPLNLPQFAKSNSSQGVELVQIAAD